MFKVSSSTFLWHRSSHVTDFDNSEAASPVWYQILQIDLKMILGFLDADVVGSV